jgi:IMP and pyridine-specific 5'-nucleotidase
VPFVLLSQPTAIHESSQPDVAAMAINAHGRYSQIMKDVEELILDHIAHQQSGTAHASKLKLLVPSVGTFFTALPLQDAFNYQDAKRCISSRRFVPPSFNDIRLVLNTAQAMSIVRKSKLELVTFDGDVTLYDDGESLTPDNPVIPRILDLLRNGTRIGIVTAAGYLEAHKYYERLYGLLDAVASSDDLREQARNRLVVMGGEANFLFTYTPDVDCKLQSVPKADWQLPEMQSWTEENVTALLDVAERALKDCVHTMRLPVSVLRKERAVGIYPSKGIKLAREQLEETVLVTQRILVSYPRAFLIKSIILTIPNRNSPKPANASPSAHSTVSISSPFKPTQTNLPQTGGNDIFVDIGDKSWGVMACQQYFGGIEGGKSLHVGDQFLSAGANDFKARLASTTAWIANPAETVYLLDEIAAMQQERVG